MKYTVLWTARAEQRLAELWMSASDRQFVADAADKIDALLRLDPLSCSESRDAGRRIIVELPLAAIFEILPQDRIVRVLFVWQVRTRREQR